MRIVNKQTAIGKDEMIEILKQDLGFNYTEEKRKDPDLLRKQMDLHKQDWVNLLRKFAREKGII